MDLARFVRAFFYFKGLEAEMPGGRPSDYRVEFCEKAHQMAAQGATDREIAEVLEISEGTFYRWRHEHPEFRKSLELGKDAADDRVEQSLYRRAVGYSHDAVKIMQYEGDAIVEPYVEHYPPDVGAAMAWLKNRRPEKWRDKQDINLTGNVVIAATQHDEKL